MLTLTPMFLSVKVKNTIPPIIYWQIYRNSKLINSFEGYNYCFFPEQPGEYIINDGTRELNVIVEKNSKVKYVKTIQELELALSTNKTDELVSISNNISFTKPLIINGTLISKTGKEKLIYTGSQIPNGELIRLKKGACIHSVGVLNKTYNATDRDLTSNLFRCAGSNVINRVKASGMRCFTNLQNSPTNIKVSNCTISDNSLWDYFVWMSGQYITIESNKVDNSRREHIVRGTNYKFVTIINNDFTNLDRRPEDADISKGCIVCQWGERIYVSGNTCNYGGLGIGPLGREVGKQYPNHRVKYAVVTNNVCNHVQMQILHGTEYFRVEYNNAKIWFENTEAGYPVDRTFKHGIVSGDISNPPTNSTKVTII